MTKDNDGKMITKDNLIKIGLPANTAKNLIKKAKLNKVSEGFDYYSTPGVRYVPREAVEWILNSPLNKMITKEQLTQIGIPEESAINVIRNAKKIMVSHGFPVYENKKLQHVPSHILELILDIKLSGMEVA